MSGPRSREGGTFSRFAHSSCSAWPKECPPYSPGAKFCSSCSVIHFGSFTSPGVQLGASCLTLIAGKQPEKRLQRQTGDGLVKKWVCLRENCSSEMESNSWRMEVCPCSGSFTQSKGGKGATSACAAVSKKNPILSRIELEFDQPSKCFLASCSCSTLQFGLGGRFHTKGWDRQNPAAHGAADFQSSQHSGLEFLEVILERI